MREEGKLMQQSELEQLVDDLSVTYFKKPFIDQVNFNQRLRTTGGRYLPSVRRIELNPKYLEELGMNEFIGIIKHELCHYHLHIAGKGYKHGDKEFKQLLKETNSPRHCQALPTTLQKSLIEYVCHECGQHYQRRRKIDLSKYRCGKCQGRLQKVEVSKTFYNFK